MDKQPPNRFWLTPDQHLGFQHFRYSDHHVYPSRFQDEYVVVVPLAGAIRVDECGRVETIRAGEVRVGNSRQRRGSSYGEAEDCHGLTLIASRRSVQNVMSTLGRREFRGWTIPYFPGVYRLAGIDRLVEDVQSEMKKQQYGHEQLLELLARELLLRCVRSWPHSHAVSVSHLSRVLTRRHYVSALDFMQACGKSEFSVVRLSGLLGLSAEEFTRLFRNSTGSTPLSTYNGLLIDRATRLLRNGADSIKEVAAALQFESVSHFSSLYKKVTGRCPSAIQ